MANSLNDLMASLAPALMEEQVSKVRSIIQAYIEEIVVARTETRIKGLEEARERVAVQAAQYHATEAEIRAQLEAKLEKDFKAAIKLHTAELQLQLDTQEDDVALGRALRVVVREGTSEVVSYLRALGILET